MAKRILKTVLKIVKISAIVSLSYAFFVTVMYLLTPKLVKVNHKDDYDDHFVDEEIEKEE